MRKAEFVHLLRVNRARLPRRPKRVPMLPPDMAAARYLRRVKQTVLADAWALVEERLLPALPALALEAQKARGEGVERADAEGPDLGAILDKMVDEYFGKWTRRRFDRIVQPFGTTLAAFHAGQMNKVLEQLVGVDVVGSEPWLADVLKAFTQQNVALIKTIPSTFFDEIEKLVTQGIAEGGRWEGMADDLRERYGVSESRAKLIARDQAGKLYGNLNRVRQTDLGIERYTWRSMRDNRVRDEHEARDGHVYTWDKSPAGGPPGQAIQCRCYADPDLEPILAEARGESSAVVGATALELAPEPERARKPRKPRQPKPPALKLPYGPVRGDSDAVAKAHPRLAELLGDKLRVDNFADPKVAREVEHLSRLPDFLLDRMRDRLGDVHISTGDLPTLGRSGSLGRLRGVQPRGWSAGSTWDYVGGLYDGSTKEVISAVNGNSGSVSTILHEFAHAVDALVNDVGVPSESDKTPFAIAWGDFTRGAFRQSRHPYYNQGWPAGAEEAFAEAFATFFAKGKAEAELDFGPGIVSRIEAMLSRLPKVNP